MKKMFFRILFLAAILSLLAALTACAESPEPLKVPENLQVEKRVLTWDAVENATGYAVYVNSEEYKTQECRFELYPMTTVGGTYNIDVMAYGDEESNLNSPSARITVELDAPAPQGADEIFQYKFLEDYAGYEVDLIDKRSSKLEGTVVIPDFFGDYPVKKLADRMFYLGISGDEDSYPKPYSERNCNKITTAVKLPAYLEIIGQNALAFMVRIEEIVIPDTVTEIQPDAFRGCTHMTRVVLPKGLKRIPSRCFQDTAVDEIVLPDTLEEIGASAFENVWFDYEWIQGTSEFIFKYLHTNMTSITFPASIKSIGKMAFAGREALENISFTNTDALTYLSNDAFSETAFYKNHPDGAIWLDNVLYAYKGKVPDNYSLVLPQNTLVAGNVFQGQKGLVSVTAPGTVRFIGDCIFKDCTSLSEVVLGEGIQSIPTGTFWETKSLKNIQLPTTLTKIRGTAFNDSGLECVVIPKNVKIIEDGAFNRCVNLKEITLPEGLEYIGNLAFANCKALEQITIPSSVKTIDMNAFSSCIALKTVVFPSGIETLSVYPFRDCDALTHLYFAGTPAEWEEMITLVPQNYRNGYDAAPIYYYSETAPAEEGNYWHYVDGKPTPWE